MDRNLITWCHPFVEIDNGIVVILFCTITCDRIQNDNGNEQVSREFLGDIFIWISFGVNHNLSSSLFEDDFKEPKAKLDEFKIKYSQSIIIQDFNLFEFSSFQSKVMLLSLNLLPIYLRICVF